VTFTLTFGCDVAGVVKEVGTGVTKFKVGDGVFACLDFKEYGTTSEYIVVSETIVSLNPTTLSFNEAAAIPLVGLIAFQGIGRSAIREKGDKKVFISGGLGGVNHTAIQLAKNYFGAKVIATTVSEKKVPLA
jgi:NADPH:quinone reductase-like Zn-dependent oxidoreductase